MSVHKLVWKFLFLPLLSHQGQGQSNSLAVVLGSKREEPGVRTLLPENAVMATGVDGLRIPIPCSPHRLFL